MIRFLGPILRRDAILAAFVLSPLLNGAADALRGAPDWPLAFGAAAVFAVLTWLTRQEWGLATWVSVVLLLFEGSNLLYDGLTGLLRGGALPLWSLPPLVLAGAYLTWGALVLHRHKRIKD